MFIRTFQIFCDVVETKSFTRAAQLNGVTQSAVSQQIASLERRLKGRLIERGGSAPGGPKKLRLTPNGQVAYEPAKQIVKTYAELCDKLQELKETHTCSVRVAAIEALGLHALPPVLERFRKAHPTWAIHVTCRSTRQAVYEDVEGNLAEVGFVAFAAKYGQFKIVPLGKDPLVLIGHPSHPLMKKKRVRLKVLAGQPFVGFERDGAMRKCIDKALYRNKTEVRYVLETERIETVKQAVEMNAGLALVPRSTITQEIRHQTLATVPLADGELDCPLAAVHKATPFLTPAADEFLAFLKTDLRASGF